MTYLGSGLSRHVFSLGRRYVLKVPRCDANDVPGPTLGDCWRRLLWGLLANMQEADYGQRGWPGLCPVVASLPGGFALVARRAAVCSVLPSDEYLRVTAESLRLLPGVGVELKPSSWGWLEGRLVAVDYG